MGNSISIVYSKKTDVKLPIAIDLPASKSISNRLLMLQHLYFSELQIDNLSEANDTQLMQRALNQLIEDKPINVEDAGTVARFISAAALFSPKKVIVAGTERMHQRPMNELIHVLEKIGATFTFTNKKHHLPFEINGIANGFIVGSNLELTLSTAVSSQFLSALLLISPKLNRQLIIHITGKRNSWSYVEMTIQLMLSFGFKIEVSANTIVIKPFIPKLEIKNITVENDWSAAAFFLEILSSLPLAATFSFFGLQSYKNSLQGDAILGQWAQDFNLRVDTLNNKTKFEVIALSELVAIRSFKNNPDLALPYIMAMVLNKKKFNIVDVESLQYKESDRMAAIKEELSKCNVSIKIIKNGYAIDATQLEVKPHTQFNSHNDHRIAMCLAPLAIYTPIALENPEVVNKSFPKYWDELRKLNFEVTNN